MLRNSDYDFPFKYKVEFTNPRANLLIEGRALLVDKALVYGYKPLSGTPEGICPINLNEGGHIMVAIAVPGKYIRHIHHKPNEDNNKSGIDLTRTYLSLFWALEQNEKAVVLGGYNFDLEGEVAKYLEYRAYHGCTRSRFAPWEAPDDNFPL